MLAILTNQNVRAIISEETEVDRRLCLIARKLEKRDSIMTTGAYFLPLWQRANAWREIMARIFENVDARLNVSPEWLVNPATNRRLKLDLLYPDLGVAVRFEGLEGKQRRRRLSLEEEEQQQVRGQARVDVCAEHDINLIVVDLGVETPRPIFQEIDTALSRAGQRLKQEPALAQAISRARTTAAALSRRVEQISQLKLYADLWEDRQYQEPAPATPGGPTGPPPAFTAGMEVNHTAFGPGVVVAVTPAEHDTLVTVDFITAGQKTLAASLVGDKLYPQNKTGR